MKKEWLEKTLALVIIVLFVVTVLTPEVFSNYPKYYNDYKESKITEQKKLLENLKFYCTTPNGFDEIKFEYYKKQLLKQETNEEDNQYKISNTEELIKIENPQLTGILPNGPLDSVWPMKCHDVHHTGRSQISTANNSYIEKWRFDCGWVEDNPIIDNYGTIYFASDWDVIAIFPNGTLKWIFETEGLMKGCSPAINEDGTIYVGSWDSLLYAINPDGTLKWKVGTGASIFTSPAIANDGTIYLGTLDPGNCIVAVNPNGTIKWKYQTGWITSDPAISDDGTIYIGSADNYLYAMNPNGTLKWRFKTGHYVKGPPSIADDGTIYIGSWDDYLYALNPNGTMKWKINVGYGTETNPSIADDGTIYVGGWEYLWAIYPNGTMKWSCFLGEDRHIFQSSPAISSDGTIYFGTNIGDGAGGEIIAVNPNGTEKWRKRIANYWVDSSPSIAEDGTVYIGCVYNIGGGYLHAFGNIESNTPPNSPNIGGPTNVNVGDENWYSFTAIDPDNNPIQLFVDWGDGTSDWVGEYASGEPIWFERAWNNAGTYIVKAKVKDVLGEESDFGYLEVKVIVPPVYKKAFIFGRITNLTIGDTIMFEAVHINVINFLPFSKNLFKSGEKFTLTKNYKGFIGYRFIFSFCTMIT